MESQADFYFAARSPRDTETSFEAMRPEVSIFISSSLAVAAAVQEGASLRSWTCSVHFASRGPRTREFKCSTAPHGKSELFSVP